MNMNATNSLVQGQNAEEMATQEPKQHKLVYLAAPYSRIEDKERFMSAFMAWSGQYMLDNPGTHLVSPLFNHYSLDKVPGLAGDYAFWGDYSRNLLVRCDELWVLMAPGWEESTGVGDEIDSANKFGLPVLCIPFAYQP